jgi:hypothetical protein
VKSLQYTPAGYWNKRYQQGRTSGAGSEGEEGAYKARYITGFCAENDITSVIDWGCGDGQVLELVRFPKHIAYLGLDVSPLIIDRMREKFPVHYRFKTVDDYHHTFPIENYRTALSLDVLFHLPDDRDYDRYLVNLFGSATQFVIIYATNTPDGRTARHVFRREFTPDIANRFPDWELKVAEEPLRPGLASFFVYEKVTQ